MNGRGGPPPVVVATLAAILLVAQQVAGRALRDAFFLSNYPVTALPNVVLGAAVISVAVAFAVSRLLVRLGPARVLPLALLGSASLHGLEWALAGSRPAAASILLYLHTATVGITLISGFWSLVSESFDPRSMRRGMARMTAGATAGGLLGGLLAERVGALATVSLGIACLAILHGAAAAVLFLFARRMPPAHPPAPAAGSDPFSGVRTLCRTPYLRNMALIVVLGAAAATLIDYAFKAEAKAAYVGGGELLRFFALFHAATSLGAFLLQISLSSVFLERMGLARTAGTLPGTVLASSLVAIVLPGLWPVAAARGSEVMLRHSLFRSGYEPHFAPVPRDRKRSCKTLIDVAGERAGDAIGGALVKGVLLVAPLAVRSWVLSLAVVAAGGTLVLVGRLRRGYVQTLEQSLLDRREDLDLDDLADDRSRDTVLKSLTQIRMDSELLAELRRQLAAPGAPEAEAPAPAPPRSGGEPLAPDPVTSVIAELRSNDARRVRGVLLRLGRMDPAVVPHVIRLLAWDAVAESALRALIRTGPRVAGQLVDALLDPEQDFAIRRRVPRALASMPGPLAAHGLHEGLRDKRFEVRFQCGRGLARLQASGFSLPVSPAEIERRILDEVAVDRGVWEGRRLLEDGESGESLFVDRVVEARANRSLEHVFTLLSLVLPRDPLRIAFHGLYSGEPALRGTALEYLESTLPAAVRESLWPFLEPSGKHPAPSGRSRDEILAALLESNQSIQIQLAELRKQAKAEPRRDDAGDAR